MSADPLLVETIERLLGDLVTPDLIEHAETTGWSGTTWDALAGAGFPWVGIDESAGGSGGTEFDLAAILAAVGRFAAPVPMAETAMIGGWLLAQAGLELPTGPVSALDGLAEIRGGRLVIDGTAAWGRHADRIVVASGSTVFAIEPGLVEIGPGANIAGEPRDRITADLAVDDVPHAVITGVAAPFDAPFDAQVAARTRGALSRVVMAAGALGAVSQMTIDYAHARHQFGKPIATFQAVQSHLVTAAQCAVAAQMAADVAVRALAGGGTGAVGFEVAAARVVVDGAITIGTRAAHQAHGAMGVTREYPLHQLTRRLWSWRHEWGTTKQWRRAAGACVVERGADGLFPLISA